MVLIRMQRMRISKIGELSEKCIFDFIWMDRFESNEHPKRRIINGEKKEI